MKFYMCHNRLLSLVVATFALTSVSFAQERPAFRKNYKTLIFGKSRGHLDPTLAFNPSELGLIGCGYLGIVQITDEGDIQGQLAERWEISKDGLTYTFHLKNLRFHDGSPITSKDVRLSLTRYMADASRAVNKNLLGALLKDMNWFHEIDSRTFAITLRSPYPMFLTLLTLPEIRVVKVTPSGLIGAGRFRLSQESDVLIHLTDTSKAAADVDAQFTYSPDDIKKDLKDGASDFYLGVPPGTLVEAQLHPGLKVVTSIRYNAQFLQLNRSKKIFSNADFRADMKRLFWTLARDIAPDNLKVFSVTRHFVARGILNPAYYRPRQFEPMDAEAFFKKWGRYIRQNGGIRFWLNVNFYQSGFLRRVREAMNLEPSITVYTGLYWEVAGEFTKNRIDLTGLDGEAYLPNLDGYLAMWQANELENFPFLGGDLVEKATHIRSSPAAGRDLAAQRAVEEFEGTNWVVPLFQINQSMVMKSSLKLPNQRFSIFDSICQAQSE